MSAQDPVELTALRARLQARLVSVSEALDTERRNKPTRAGLAIMCAVAIALAVVVGHEGRRVFENRVPGLPNPAVTPGVAEHLSMAELCAAPRKLSRSISPGVRLAVLSDYRMELA